jgi:hypothetical protein
MDMNGFHRKLGMTPGAVVYLLILVLAPLRDAASAQATIETQNERKPEPVESAVTRDPSGIVRVKYERGGKIMVGNRTTGPIVVIGWDRDYIEASALSDRGTESVRAFVDPGPAGARIGLKADYADFDEIRLRSGSGADPLAARRQISKPDATSNMPVPLPPPAPSQAPDFPSGFSSRPGELFIEIKVPRYAEIEAISVIRSEVLVVGIETPITVNGERSAVRLKRIGSAQVRTRGGDVEVEDSEGLVDVITTGGAIVVKGARTDVRALSLSGRIDIQCARGRVDVNNTDGSITLSGVTGDVSATATNSPIRFSGAIRADGRYYLKSMSGSVEMEVPANSPGFTATLSSYRGGVGADFQLKTAQPSAGKGKSGSQPDAAVNRRLIGRFGNGQAQITLDSFDGKVRLGKMAAGAATECR